MKKWGMGLLLSTMAISAPVAKFPIFSDEKIEKPQGVAVATAESFPLVAARVSALKGRHLYGEKETFQKLTQFFQEAPEGQEAWKDLTAAAAKVVNQWDFNRRGFGADRYIYRLVQLENLSVVYLLSGHPDLGAFIKAHLLHVAALPMEFWLHAELRGYDPQKPLGMLETSSASVAVASALSSVGDLLTAPERQEIEQALAAKGLTPLLHWLDKPQKNNFTAVVGTGAYVAASYLGHREGMAKALTVLAGYLEGSIEKDGSYGEGNGYFAFPVYSMLPAVLAMPLADRDKLFSPSGLRHSGSWLVYPYFYAVGPDGKKLTTLAHFGDNGYSLAPSTPANTLLSVLYQSRQAAWLLEKFGRSMGLKERILSLAPGSALASPQSPAEAGLPLVKVFDSGDCYIRSTWNDNGIVMALRTGNGSRVEYSHQRPELNSICLGAYGEYLVVSAGSASYRSPLHYSWDNSTRAANTLTIDGKNQLFPGKGGSAWVKTDNKDQWVEGRPRAEVVSQVSNEFFDLLVNEAAGAYAPKMKQARRALVFVRNPGYFALIDFLDAEEGAHEYTWRLHLNNRDGQGLLEPSGDGAWHFKRPRAEMGISLVSDGALQSEIGQGYFHGAERDYSPGGENEGKPGSSVELAVANKNPSRRLTLFAILFPKAKDQVAPAVSTKGLGFQIGGDELGLVNGVFSFRRGSEVKSQTLWP